MNIEDLLREEYEAGCRDARPPAAGVVWFRAERRRRTEAARMASRPVTVVHAIAGACAIGVAAALLQLLAPWLRRWIDATGGLATRLSLDPVMLASPYVITIALVAVAALVLAPLAVYVALLDD